MEIDIRPTGIASAVAYKPFDQALAELKTNRFLPIDLRTNALLRIQQGRNHPVSINGNYTAEGWRYRKGLKGAYLVPKSSILENAQEATQAHRDEKEFYLNQDFKLENGILVPYNQKPIQTNRFGEEELTTFVFGDQAQDYGQSTRLWSIFKRSRN